jgi:hypothetical protein
MISSADAKSEGCQNSINQIKSQIEDLTNQKTALKEGVGDVLANELTTYLFQTYPQSEDVIWFGPNFNNIYIPSGSLTEWRVFINTFDNTKLDVRYKFYFVSDTEFRVFGDVPDIFKKRPPFPDISFGTHFEGTYNDVSYTNISEVYYDGTSSSTHVIVKDPIIKESNDVLFLYKASFWDPADKLTSKLQSKWEFAHDYIVRPMGPQGTYGLNDMIDKLSMAKGMMAANISKYQDSKKILYPFANPGSE